MMKQFLAATFCALVLGACGNTVKQPASETSPVTVIFETDMGNDVDDALALAMLYNYVDQGKIDLIGIGVNKPGMAPVGFLDIMGAYYGYPDIPVGVVSDGADCENDAVNYAKAVVEMKDENGKPLFARTANRYDNLPDAVTMYRKLLASQPDSSVTIISVGFSTNLARLLDSPADSISPLTGFELAARKVRLVSAMAGSATNPEMAEYNVVKDIDAARKVLAEWPGEIVISPFEVGIGILYPADVIENGYEWSKGHNPIVEAYKSYLAMPYDRPAWDLTSVLYAVEGADGFTVSEPMNVTVDELGHTAFIPSHKGTRRYLSTDSIQNDAIKKRLIELTTFIPVNYEEEK